MPKMMLFHEKALKALHKGVQTLAKAVKVTLGPRGRNVVIAREGLSPSSTKDGVSVAREIFLKDKYENMGAQLVKEAASRASDVAGDGTTTAIVLAEAIFSEGLKNIAAGANPMDVKKGIEKAVKVIEAALDKMAKPVQTPGEIEQIAHVSANNDPFIGALLRDAMQRVGKDGIVTIGEAKGLETTLDVVEGMQFDKGYVSPYFVTNAEQMTAELDRPLILITDKKLSNVKEMASFLEKVMSEGPEPLLIIAEDFDADALATLVINKVKGSLPVCAVKAPSFGDQRKALLEDLCSVTGATLVSDQLGYDLEKVGLEVLGSAKRVRVSKDDTTIVDGRGRSEQIESRKKQIKAELSKPRLSDYEKEKLEERLAKLSGGIAVIHVGAATETEANEKKDRIEDALHATRAAVSQGILPGGGVALIRAAKALENLHLEGDEAIGCRILHKACFSPATVIARNCGKNGELIAEKISEKEGAFGFNGLTGAFSDLIQDGVMDPLLVTKSALVHAASISSMLLTISAMVTDKPEPQKKSTGPAMPPGMPPGMGGMGGMDFGSMM